MPQLVRAKTDEYRSEMATLSTFIEDRCVLGPDQWASSSQIMAAYNDWCAVEGYRFPMGPKRLGEGLRARGCTPKKRNNTRGWLGISLPPRLVDTRDGSDTSQGKSKENHT